MTGVKYEQKGQKMIYAYERISTPKQNLERQERNIKALYPTAITVKETYTGTKMNREKWNNLMKNIKPGDTIVFDSVSRMSRNAEEGYSTYEELFSRGIDLVFLKEPQINTETYKRALNGSIEMTGTIADYILEGVNKYLLALAKEQIKLAFEQSQKEVDDLHQRTKEGLETARLNGKQIGQRKGIQFNVKKKAPAKDMIRKYSKTFGGSLKDKDVIKLCDINRTTYYKYKNELKAEFGM